MRGRDLTIGRRAGEGIYIGREIHLRVTRTAVNGIGVMVTAPGCVVVTDSDFELSDHNRRQEVSGSQGAVTSREFIMLTEGGLFIGKGVEVTLVELALDGYARIVVDAPRWMAVTRDEYAFEQHMLYQTDREAGKMTVPGRA